MVSITNVARNITKKNQVTNLTELALELLFNGLPGEPNCS